MTGFVVPAPKPKPDPIDNTELVEAFRALGGGILHLQPKYGRRGITIAFVAHKSSRIEFATAVQHRSDTFTKKQGTKNAIEHFNNGQTVFLPIQKHVEPVDFFQTMACYL